MKQLVCNGACDVGVLKCFAQTWQAVSEPASNLTRSRSASLALTHAETWEDKTMNSSCTQPTVLI